MVAGTRDAVAEQLRLGQELRRKIDRPEDSTSDEEGSSDNDDSATDASEAEDGAAARPNSRRAVAKAKAAYLDMVDGALHCRPEGNGNSTATQGCCIASKCVHGML